MLLQGFGEGRASIYAYGHGIPVELQISGSFTEHSCQSFEKPDVVHESAQAFIRPFLWFKPHSGTCTDVLFHPKAIRNFHICYGQITETRFDHLDFMLLTSGQQRCQSEMLGFC